MINPLVIDVSHWDPPQDYVEIKANGIAGVICKATESQTYNDPTYKSQRQRAIAAGLAWGSYHFADNSDPIGQAKNYLNYAQPKPGELICLDWEDNKAGTMSPENLKAWTTYVEEQLARPGEVVIYSGNTAKEQLRNADQWFGDRRLWLAQYGTNPTTQSSWKTYWLWQYTDGQVGPEPHNIGSWRGDINSYAGSTQQLLAEWASGKSVPVPIPTPSEQQTVTITITLPLGATVRVVQT